MTNIIQKAAKKMESIGGKMGMGGHRKAFIADMFIIGLVLFALYIAAPILSGIGVSTTAQVIQNNPQLNASQIAQITKMSNNWFLNSPDIMLVVFYFVLVLVAFIAAGYEGANPAVTLLVGVIFIIVAEVISFGLADYAHTYITQTAYLNIAQHYQLSTYIMEYLPYFNGVLTIAYIIFVIIKREGTVAQAWSGGGGGGGVIST